MRGWESVLVFVQQLIAAIMALVGLFTDDVPSILFAILLVLLTDSTSRWFAGRGGVDDGPR